MGLLRSKVAGILFAAVLIGSVSSALAVLAASRPNDVPPASAALLNTSTGTTATTGTTSASGTPSATVAHPTHVPTPRATATPRPTPTVLPFGPGTIHGRVVSISRQDSVTGTFVLNVSGRPYTCDVSSSTQWTSLTVTSFSELRANMFATVQGSLLQADGTFAASSVNARLDN